MEQLTPLERVKRVVNGELPDRVPVIPGVGHQYVTALTGIPIPELVSDPRKMSTAVLMTWKRHGYDAIGPITYAALGADQMGCKVIIENHRVIGTKEPALKSPSDFKELQMPDPTRDGNLPVVLECERILKADVGKNLPVGGGFEGPFSFAGMLRGLKEFFSDLILHTDFARQLVEFSTDFLLDWGRAQIELGGVDSLTIFEPTASPAVVSPKIFEQLSFPYLKKLIAEFKNYGVGTTLHICGNTTPILKRMVETGASTLSLENQVNLAEAKAITENKVCVSGNVDSFRLALGPRDEILQTAKQCVLETKPGGRFILSSACEVPMNTPPENLDALIQAAREFGRYE